MIDRIVCDKFFCTGCSACFSFCPMRCIKMEEDGYGFLYPRINSSLCIGCNKCINVCPQINHDSDFRRPIECYAIRIKNVEKRRKSTSGGGAIALMESFLNLGGVVYCTSYDKGVIAIRRFSQEEFSENLAKINGSKYAQTVIGDAFINVKNDLDSGSKVLFVSTPCQVDGLYHFIGFKTQNLYTVDLVCHGVPSQKMLFDHLKNCGLRVEEMETISFRKGAKYHLSVSDGSKIVYSKNLFYDKYLEGFLSNLSLRDCCFGCLYARPERVADITLGDFWGLLNDCKLKIEDGVNLIMVNTSKGNDLFSLLGDYVDSEKRTVEEAVSGNAQLRGCSKPHEKRRRFKAIYLKKGFDKAVKSSRRLKTRIRYLPFIRKRVLKRYE